MTDDELVTLLQRSLQAQDRDAPTAESIQRRLRSAAPSVATSQHPSRWLPAVAAAACVLLVVGAVAIWSAGRRADGPPAPANHRQSQSPSTRDVTVFLARYDPNSKPHYRRWYLVPQQVAVPDTGDPGLDAVRALLAQQAPDGLVNWFHLGSRPVAKVNSVRVTNDQITVDIDRSLRDPYPSVDCHCPDIETVLQQLAWTVSTALENQDSISLTVNGRPAGRVHGRPVTQSGRPDSSAIAEADRSFAWYEKACGRRTIVAVAGDGRRIDVPPPGNSLRPTATVTLQVGDTLRFTVTGECFNPLSAGTDGSSVLRGATDPNERLTIVARAPGHAVASVGGGACTPSFTQGMCTGKFVLAGSVTVHVVRP